MEGRIIQKFVIMTKLNREILDIIEVLKGEKVKKWSDVELIALH